MARESTEAASDVYLLRLETEGQTNTQPVFLLRQKAAAGIPVAGTGAGHVELTELADVVPGGGRPHRPSDAVSHTPRGMPWHDLAMPMTGPCGHTTAT